MAAQLSGERGGLKPPLTKQASFELKRVGEDGSFSGFASLFGEADLGGDLVLPGAFRKSLEKRGPKGVKLLYQHDPAEPIGVWHRIEEVAEGLKVSGRILPSVARGREVLALMREGALDGLSIGYHTVRARKDQKTGYRELIEVDLWEISVVTFPLHPGARISSVKGHALTEREFERWLTQDAGLSRREARLVIGQGFKALKAERDAAAGAHREGASAALIASLAAARLRFLA